MGRRLGTGDCELAVPTEQVAPFKQAVGNLTRGQAQVEEV